MTNHLVHPVKPVKPWKAMLKNSWVLLLMVGILVVILLAKSRLHVPEALEHVHACTNLLPYFMPLSTSSV
jgi:hypothetical protein